MRVRVDTVIVGAAVGGGGEQLKRSVVVSTICLLFSKINSLRRIWKGVLKVQIGGEGVAAGRSGDDSVVERVRGTRVVSGKGQGVDPRGIVVIQSVSHALGGRGEGPPLETAKHMQCCTPDC